MHAEQNTTWTGFPVLAVQPHIVEKAVLDFDISGVACPVGGPWLVLSGVITGNFFGVHGDRTAGEIDAEAIQQCRLGDILVIQSHLHYPELPKVLNEAIYPKPYKPYLESLYDLEYVP